MIIRTPCLPLLHNLTHTTLCFECSGWLSPSCRGGCINGEFATWRVHPSTVREGVPFPVLGLYIGYTQARCSDK